MAYGLVQDTTLQAIADSLRNKGIIPATREVNFTSDKFTIITPNVTNEETLEYSGGFGSYTVEISIPTATTLEVRLVRLNAPHIGASGIGSVRIDGGGSYTIWSSMYETDMFVVPVNKNYTTVSFTDYSQSIGGENKIYAAVVEVYALDADGNYMTEIPQSERVPNTVTLEDMAEGINNAPAYPPDEAYHITSSADYMFSNGKWDWFIEQYGHRIMTAKLTRTTSMFNGSKITTIPFELNYSTSDISMNYMFNNCRKLVSIPDITINPSTYIDMASMFTNCEALVNPPYIYNAYPSGLANFMDGCQRMRELPTDYTDTWNFDRIQTYQYSSVGSMFQNCYSLRRAPTEFLKKCCGIQTSSSSCFYYNLFKCCYALDEVVNLPVHNKVKVTSNMFSGAFKDCGRVKNITFELDPDTNAPYVAQWKSQFISLGSGQGVGHVNVGYVTDYNSGITRDTLVENAETYQALKDNPDWFTNYQAYSRYNHDSAVNTINSLPDTSAYLATAGGTNTITFDALAGSDTDGGAIGTLTEAEIAVAVAKGWTVTFG